MKIIYDGKDQPFDVYAWINQRKAEPESRPALDRMAREGAIFGDDGTELTGRTLQRVRDRLLGTYEPASPAGRRESAEEKRWLIPDLWEYGTIPMLGGNPKAGKSTIVTDLVPSLLVPGYRFLDHFEAADVPEDERDCGIVLINAETSPMSYEAALDRGMTEEAWRRLRVEHLEDSGGAQIMDLTDPAAYDMWAHRLADCDECDGSDDWTPFVVIVDGLTAILQAAGKGMDDYGLWLAAFRRLMREIDVPNALAVVHNTLQGGHSMGGVGSQAGSDGLWTYSSVHSDDPNSKRRFSVRPRMGGVAVPAFEVVMKDERPVAEGTPPESKADKEPAADPVTTIAHRMVEYVRKHPGADGVELEKNVDAGGWKENSLKGRSKAVGLGLIRQEKCGTGCKVCTRPHHNRRHYWPITPTPTV